MSEGALLLNLWQSELSKDHNSSHSSIPDKAPRQARKEGNAVSGTGSTGEPAVPLSVDLTATHRRRTHHPPLGIRDTYISETSDRTERTSSTGHVRCDDDAFPTH
ncbi:hypothetical protein Bbelb_405080 [Branchiostoma belcheri]|nr:hypothetical protein Bbelb_440110 [Branchiostoma belcheri]KAI8481751.1 hypothetical protein Bbelb_405080 [Branchiostoma belcheri]